MGRRRRLSKDCERLGDSPLASGVRHPAPPVRACARHERPPAACRFPIRRVARKLTPGTKRLIESVTYVSNFKTQASGVGATEAPGPVGTGPPGTHLARSLGNWRDSEARRIGETGAAETPRATNGTSVRGSSGPG